MDFIKLYKKQWILTFTLTFVLSMLTIALCCNLMHSRSKLNLHLFLTIFIQQLILYLWLSSFAIVIFNLYINDLPITLSSTTIISICQLLLMFLWCWLGLPSSPISFNWIIIFWKSRILSKSWIISIATTVLLRVFRLWSIICRMFWGRRSPNRLMRCWIILNCDVSLRLLYM